MIFPTLQPKLTHQDAHRILREASADPRELFEEAGRIRAQRTGGTITYSRKVFIPLTNLCRDQCGYCTFARLPEDPRAHTMSPAEVLAVAEAGRAAGCKEALFSLGERPELRYPAYKDWLEDQGYASTIDYLAAMCQLVFERTGLLPHANPGTMTRREIEKLRPYNVSMGMMLESVSQRLSRRGEAHHACPDKVPAARLATLEASGELRVPFTTGILIGIGETMEERVDSLFAIRDIHARYGQIQEVIVQNFRAKPDTRFAHWPEPETGDLLTTAALARLIFGDDVNIQIPPNLTTPGFASLLRAGINDWGGISPVTRDFINPEHVWPAIPPLRAVTKEAGFDLRERLAIYPEFVRERMDCIPQALRVRVKELAEESGLVRTTEERW